MLFPFLFLLLLPLLLPLGLLLPLRLPLRMQMPLRQRFRLPRQLLDPTRTFFDHDGRTIGALEYVQAVVGAGAPPASLDHRAQGSDTRTRVDEYLDAVAWSWWIQSRELQMRSCTLRAHFVSREQVLTRELDDCIEESRSRWPARTTCEPTPNRTAGRSRWWRRLRQNLTVDRHSHEYALLRGACDRKRNRNDTCESHAG